MFRGMEYVYEVYKERSFSKAAENLAISQPSLSATVKKIEARVGAPIFDRSTNPIRLTDCGVEYIKSIEQIMDIETGFENYLSDLQDIRIGRLALGASNFFSSFILPPFVARYIHRYPRVKVNLVEANTPELEKMLLAGSLDLMIDNYLFHNNTFEKRFFLSEHLILAVPKQFSVNEALREYQLTVDEVNAGKHLDQSVPPVPLAFLQDTPFVLLKPGNDTRARAERICHYHGLAPQVILELDQMATAYNVVTYGVGAAFINDTLVRMVRQEERNIAYYKLDSPHTKRDVFLYSKNNRYVTRAMAEFQRMVTESNGGQRPPE